ncbi:GNAT family N-acetyltransferase [Neobacillus niacini]|uniref:GNAT family N-acetyltransferase n=1 Tax=Neobacillus niacini TaxID=86668 RepID=UPI0005EDA058|nr:N-acetyltransferase [Neobacillus niacini]
MIIIRQEQPTDYRNTENVVKNAFSTVEISDKKEHELVSRLRKSEAFIPELSFVAVSEDTNEILAHILLTKIKIKNDHLSVESLALAPVSVLPEYQNKGIGKSLILESLKIAKAVGYQSVVVLGHPDYYPKFGFKPTSQWGIRLPFDVSEKYFMALELEDRALENVDGIVEYSRAFFE